MYVLSSNKIGQTFRKVLIIVLFVIGEKWSLAYEDESSSETSCGKLDYTWSSPEECSRPCKRNETPRYYHYRFTLEYYTTMNDACGLCRPNSTNQLSNIGQCECVEADGYERTVLTANRMIPGPSIQVCEDDMVIVDVTNKIDGIGASLHWHGLFQEGYQYYDGVPFVTQCPIHSSNKFRYQFRVKNAGTHFWHSHNAIHKLDGLYGSLIVRKPPNEDPQAKLYDHDLPTHVIVLSDWMHELWMERSSGLLTRLKGQGPVNVLINGKGTWESPITGETIGNTSIEIFNVEPGRRYRFRVINAFSTVCLARLNIENHTMSVIAQDGNNVLPQMADSIITGSGERVDFVLTTDQPSNRSYWIQVRAINEVHVESPQQMAVLRYAGSVSSVPPTERPGYWNGLKRGIIYNPLDAPCNGDGEKKRFVCPYLLESSTGSEPDSDLLAVDPDYQFVLPYKFHSHKRDIKRLFEPGTYESFVTAPDKDLQVILLDGIIYEEPPEPLILQPNQRKCNGSTSNLTEGILKPRICTHILEIERETVVEIVLFDANEEPRLNHPFHLHGHAFRLFEIGSFTGNRSSTLELIDPILRNHRKRLIDGSYGRRVPAKDTVVVPQNGWAILRFKANNPGWWLFHCHFGWHAINGMNLIIHVGEQRDLPPIPPDFPRCGDFKPPVCPAE